MFGTRKAVVQCVGFCGVPGVQHHTLRIKTHPKCPQYRGRRTGSFLGFVNSWAINLEACHGKEEAGVWMLGASVDPKQSDFPSGHAMPRGFVAHNFPI